MSPTAIGSIVFACTLSGALLGMWLRRALPGHHVEAESKDTIKVGVGLIATMTALVLGLVTASAKSSFDAVDHAIRQTSVEVVVLDRTLARYGPETAPVRQTLKQLLQARIDAIWPSSGGARPSVEPGHANVVTGESLAAQVHALQPQDDMQRSLKAKALDQIETLLQARWLALAGTEPSVPAPFLAILLFWLTLTFLSFGLFAPRNGTVVAVLCVCALSIGSAVFLVLEMDSPFGGLLKVSATPMRNALAQLNQ